MRRTALTIIATVVGLVLLLQFKTHPLGGSTSGGLASLGTVPVNSSSSRTSAARHKAHHKHRTPPSPTATSAAPHPKSSRPTTTVPSDTPRSPKTVTATGQTIQTRYGPVQVRITETSGRLTSVAAIQLPGGDPHSTQIASYAAPILRTEALKANSARIDVVSGATYTSDGYAQSLQSALDNA
jgi:uncharacterized protein with FMN-binding domain